MDGNFFLIHSENFLEGPDDVGARVRYREYAQVCFALHWYPPRLEPFPYFLRSEFAEGVLEEFRTTGVFAEEDLPVGDASGHVASASAGDGDLLSEDGVLFEEADFEIFRGIFDMIQEGGRAHLAGGAPSDDRDGFHGWFFGKCRGFWEKDQFGLLFFFCLYR